MNERYSVHSTMQYVIAAFLIFIIAVLLATPYYMLALVPGLGIFLFVTFVSFPMIAYYIIIFLVPYDAYRGLLETFKFLTISKFFGVLLIAVVLVRSMINKTDYKKLSSNLWPACFLFFFVNIISALLSENYAVSLDFLRKTLIALSFFTLSLYFIRAYDFSVRLPVILITSITISSLLSILGYVFNIKLFVMGLDTPSIKRAIGTTFDPNTFSAMIIFMLPLLVHFLVRMKGFFQRLMISVILLINVMGIVLTYSRGGALVLIAVIGLLFLEHYKRFRPKYVGFILFAVAFTILIGSIMIPTSYWERQKSILSKTDTSLGRRSSYLLVGCNAFMKHPLLGSGPGSFMEVYGQSSYAQLYAKNTMDLKRAAHNSYLEVLVGTGITGFIAYLLIFGIGFRNFGHAAKLFLIKNRDDMAALVRAYRLSFLSICIYFLILSINYHKYFWLALALSQISLKIAHEQVQDD